PPTVSKEMKEKKSGKGKQKAKQLETISEAMMAEADQIKIITKRSRKETHSSHASGSGTDEGTGVTPGDDEDNDVHDDDENAQDDNDESQTKSEDDGDDFIHPKLTTHDDEIIHEEETDEDDTFDPIVHTPSRISSSDDKNSDNEVEGVDVEKSKSSSVSLALSPNKQKPNQDTGVDDYILDNMGEATSLIDTPVTAIVEPSFSAPTNHPPTSNPLIIQLQQPPILTPATTTSSSLQNLPNFASLFGFDYRLKALEDNFSELRQTNQYAEALSSIPGIVDHYLANKMQEAVDVAVQLKYDRIREESNTED
ncbi:hypothetical protein Tco_0935294, partial [Tanacetum coccineum]